MVNIRNEEPIIRVHVLGEMIAYLRSVIAELNYPIGEQDLYRSEAFQFVPERFVILVSADEVVGNQVSCHLRYLFPCGCLTQSAFSGCSRPTDFGEELWEGALSRSPHGLGCFVCYYSGGGGIASLIHGCISRSETASRWIGYLRLYTREMCELGRVVVLNWTDEELEVSSVPGNVEDWSGATVMCNKCGRGYDGY